MVKILALALLIGCTSNNTTPNPDPQPTEIGKTILQDCGQPPVQPGLAVYFDHTANQASMSIDNFNAFQSWRDAVSAWNNCVTTHP